MAVHQISNLCHVQEPFLTHAVILQDLVRRTWVKGNNEEFLTRTLKYAQRQKWPALLKAFHTAAAKVCHAPAPTSSDLLAASPDLHVLISIALEKPR